MESPNDALAGWFVEIRAKLRVYTISDQDDGGPWLDRHVRAKEPLGTLYPQVKYLMEGDTPSFLCLIDNGLGDPEHPDWGSWGGRYEF